VYIPGAQQLTASVREQLQDCSCLLFDGTCWQDDELVRLGIAKKTSRDMGHLPISGSDGSLKQLAPLPIERKIYIHINNTNPILIEDSPERRTAEEHGFEVAADGLELEI
jgi:pyrroloquinoline quinone biosynthesis protein B